MRWTGHVARIEKMRDTNKNVVYKPEETIWVS